MGTDLSFWIDVLTLITDIMALFLNLADFRWRRDGPMKTEKSDMINFEIDTALEYFVPGRWILIEIHDPCDAKILIPLADGMRIIIK